VAGTTAMSASINDVLPPEILVLCFSFLDRFDGSLAQQVCRLWCTLLRDESTRLPRMLKKNTKLGDISRITWAARYGYLDIFKWAREQGCLWTQETCCAAAAGGHLSVLRWAREHGYPWEADTCVFAACGGHLSVLRWAREQGYTWDEKTCWAAALGGHLDILRWATEHGCPWDKSTCFFAASGGHQDVLRWLDEQDCPCGSRNHGKA
jgi:hypothetical protein